MNTLTSCRLRLRKLTSQDANFMVALVNDPQWLEHIGDHGVKTRQDALVYMQNGPQAMYRQHALGLLLVETLEEKTPLGLCGLLQRPHLPHPDLGFAFLPQYRRQGYAIEAAKAVLANAQHRNLTQTVLATTSVNNEKSIKLLTKLGFEFKEVVTALGSGEQTKLFELSLETGYLSY